VPNTERLEPVLPPRYDGQVWHYTDTAGLLGVISDNALRASSVWSLNDSGEFNYGVDLVKRRWESEQARFENQNEVAPLLLHAETRLRLEDVFIACGSRDGGSLSQWRSYGSYAVAIDPSARLQVRTTDSAGPPIAKWTETLGEAQKAVETGWRKVLYEEHEKHQHIDKLFSELSRLAPLYTGEASEESRTSYRLAMELYSCTVAFLKHEAFRDEKEVRLLARYFSEDAGVRLRTGRFGIVPYVLVESAQELIREDLPQGHQPPKRFPLQKITVGPGLQDPNAAARGLRVALRLHRFDIEPSSVDLPFR
jgi:hypothetical protein